MKKMLLLFGMFLFLISCGKKESTSSDLSKPTTSKTTEAKSDYDPVLGEGKFKDIEIADKLDLAMAKSGEAVANTKCTACHKLNSEKLVGPGWEGVTERRSAAWIMNFITNPDPMIDKDPELQTQLEICLVRMPNQNVTDEEARQIYEYLRQNDGVK